MEWLTDHKIPIGKSIKVFVDYLNDYLFWFFDAISVSLGFLIEGLMAVLQAVPPLLLVALIAAAAFWLHRSWRLVAAIVGAVAAGDQYRLLGRDGGDIGAGAVCHHRLHGRSVCRWALPPRIGRPCTR